MRNPLLLLLLVCTLLGFQSCSLQDHQPVGQVPFRPADIYAENLLQARYVFIGYQEGNLDQFNPKNITPGRRLGMYASRFVSSTNPDFKGNVLELRGDLNLGGYLVFMEIADELYNLIQGWGAIRVGSKQGTRGNTGPEILEETIYTEYLYATSAFRVDVVDGVKYLRFKTQRPGEQPRAIVYQISN